MKRFLGWLVSDHVVMAVIVVNALALVLHEMTVPGAPSAAFWYWVDYACVWFFLVEVLTKVQRGGWPAYWASAWNRFDFTVVMLSLPALLGPFLDVRQFAFVLILRLGRLFRLFRVLRFIPNLDRLAAGARRALRASVGLFLALLLANLILAVIATLLFRDIDPKHFGNPVTAGYSVFQVFTVEGWNDIAEGLVASAEGSGQAVSLAFVFTVRMFFLVTVVVGGILGLSLANAVFVDQMMSDNHDALEAKVDRLLAEVRSLRGEMARRTPLEPGAPSTGGEKA
jgi:voltage-gated sodium channel